MNIKSLLACVAFSLVAVPFAACDSVETLVDCNAICDKYADCFDPDADVEECRNRCEENADDEAYADDVDACEACIDDKTCVESAVECTAECGGIVQ